MNPLLEQFLSEAREFLQGIAEKLLQLENDPGSAELMNELFRLVHTLKGNSGLFDFPEMTRVLHAGEDLMDAVRDGRVEYSQALADRLLDAMDFVSELIDEIEADGKINTGHSQDAVALSEVLRNLIASSLSTPTDESTEIAQHISIEVSEAQQSSSVLSIKPSLELLNSVPEADLMAYFRQCHAGGSLTYLEYTPEDECFFKGEDPLYLVRQIPNIIAKQLSVAQPWGDTADLDIYRCNLTFCVLTTTTVDELQELFRYTLDQVQIVALPAIAVVVPTGDANGGPVYGEFVDEALNYLNTGDLAGLEAVSRTMLELSAPTLWLSSALRWLLLILELEPENIPVQQGLIEALSGLQVPDWFADSSVADTRIDSASSQQVTVAEPKTPSALEPTVTSAPNALSTHEIDAFNDILNAQREVLRQNDQVAWHAGRLASVAATLAAVHKNIGRSEVLPSLNAALAKAQENDSAEPLLLWLDHLNSEDSSAIEPEQFIPEITPVLAAEAERPAADEPVVAQKSDEADKAGEVKFGRRAEDAYTGPKTLKVDQEKIDHLMGLIGEMVVAKNSLPYLASRAETQFGVRELAREIKAQYAVVNRIAEEMQDAIMKVRMMPVAFVFQRFPRLVRDTARKLGKEVNLVLEGENTEADKNIIESLADPLIHIVRNSLDHGIESTEQRKAAGKPVAGRLTIRATQESDQVYIEIVDDGKGLDPDVIKRKAYEKGIIDEATLERISDSDAINLIFAAGFSTAEKISDLSGRGVGMDVVRTAIERVNGTVSLESEKGKGTRIRLSLPLSMAVTNVMIIEFDQQIFGIPMDMVVETVRVPRASVRTIKGRQTTVLRGRIIPLLSLNSLLGLHVMPKANEDDELATLVVKVNDENVGILVDDFHETVDIILKPMNGILTGLAGYSGSALLGDGSVLMVLNPRELV